MADCCIKRTGTTLGKHVVNAQLQNSLIVCSWHEGVFAIIGGSVNGTAWVGALRYNVQLEGLKNRRSPWSNSLLLGLMRWTHGAATVVR